MRRRYLFITLFVAAAAGLFAWQQARQTTPSPLAEDRLQAFRPASEFLNPDASIDYLLERTLKQPEVAENYVALAQAYLQQAQETAREAHFIPLAERAIDEALRRDAGNYHARLLRARLLNTLHRFDEALPLIDDMLVQYPEHAYLHGLRVDALVELGRYEEAVAACDQMLALRPDLGSYARAAYLRELHGDGDGALEAMGMAADAGVAGRADRAWALYQLGNLYLGAGDLERAAFVFEGTLEERPAYGPALAGLAHVALARGHFDGAIGQLEAARAADPHPLYDELLAEAYASAGRPADARRARAQVRKALAAAEAMGENVDLEIADFLADEGTDLDDALRRIRAEYERRPGHLHVNETYGWVLHKRGHAAEALPYLERALRLSDADAMVLYRLAVATEAAGQKARSHRLYRQALDAGLHLESPSAAAWVKAHLG